MSAAVTRIRTALPGELGPPRPHLLQVHLLLLLHPHQPLKPLTGVRFHHLRPMRRRHLLLCKLHLRRHLRCLLRIAPRSHHPQHCLFLTRSHLPCPLLARTFPRTLLLLLLQRHRLLCQRSLDLCLVYRRVLHLALLLPRLEDLMHMAVPGRFHLPHHFLRVCLSVKTTRHSLALLLPLHPMDSSHLRLLPHHKETALIYLLLLPHRKESP